MEVCRILDSASVVSSQSSVRQSALVDRVPDIAAETRHTPPLVSRPPKCFCRVSLICTMFPANWIKSPQGAYCQICELLRSKSALCGEGSFTGTCVLFQHRPYRQPDVDNAPGVPGPPQQLTSRIPRWPPAKSEGVAVATRPNQTSHQGTLVACLAPPGHQEARGVQIHVCAVPSCKTSQGPILSDPCDRPILVLSDVEILTCEYGAGLMCVILG